MKGSRILAKCLLSIGALALAACGGDSGEPSAAPGNHATAPTAAPTTERAYTSLTGDPANGAAVFRQCAVCHALEPGVNRLGPSLAALVGRAAGAVEGFSYSPANRGSDLIWTEEQLYTYLRDPRGPIPGTTMAFAGLADPQDRADVIAHIKTAN